MPRSALRRRACAPPHHASFSAHRFWLVKALGTSCDERLAMGSDRVDLRLDKRFADDMPLCKGNALCGLCHPDAEKSMWRTGGAYPDNLRSKPPCPVPCHTEVSQASEKACSKLLREECAARLPWIAARVVSARKQQSYG